MTIVRTRPHLLAKCYYLDYSSFAKMNTVQSIELLMMNESANTHGFVVGQICSVEETAAEIAQMESKVIKAHMIAPNTSKRFKIRFSVKEIYMYPAAEVQEMIDVRNEDSVLGIRRINLQVSYFEMNQGFPRVSAVVPIHVFVQVPCIDLASNYVFKMIQELEINEE